MSDAIGPGGGPGPTPPPTPPPGPNVPPGAGTPPMPWAGMPPNVASSLQSLQQAFASYPFRVPRYRRSMGGWVLGAIVAIVLMVALPIVIPILARSSLEIPALPGEPGVADHTALHAVDVATRLCPDGRIRVNAQVQFDEEDGGKLWLPPDCAGHPERFFGCSSDVSVDGATATAGGDVSSRSVSIGRRSATVSYTMIGTVRAYQDIAVVQLPLLARDPEAFSSDEAVPITGRLDLPGKAPASAVEPHFHGDGVEKSLTFAGSTIRFSAESLLSSDVSLHAAIPPRLVNRLSPDRVVPTTGRQSFDIQEQVEDATESIGSQVQGGIDTGKHVFRIVILSIGIGLPLVMWVIVGMRGVARIVSRRREPPGGPQYLSDPPSADDPAVVAVLAGRGKPKPVAVAGMILSMAAMGLLDVQHLPGGQFRLRVKQGAAPATPGETIVLRELGLAATLHGGEVSGPPLWNEDAKWWQDVRIDAVQRAQYRGLAVRAFSTGGVTTAAVLTAIGLGLIFFLSDPELIVFSAIGASIVGRLLSLRGGHALTDSGKLLLAQWLAYGRHLKDQTALDDPPVGSVVIWGPQLAYGAVLGVAPTAARALSPPEQPEPFFPVFRVVRSARAITVWAQSAGMQMGRRAWAPPQVPTV